MESDLLVTGAFQVYNINDNELFQYLDGRLLSDIRLEDNLVLIKSFDKEDNKEVFYISNDRILTYIKIKELISYGISWTQLEGGMSARMKCECDIRITKDAIIYKVIE